VRIVGDRFVFQSEVLFGSGSAQIGEQGQAKLGQFAATLREIAPRIPKTIGWILQVEGHTDTIPIHNEQFRSNWELSAARAISVVKYLVEQGIPAERLSATGYGEYQPIDPADLERNRRIEMKLTQR
jgi:chemotaxis protein MotB